MPPTNPTDLVTDIPAPRRRLSDSGIAPVIVARAKDASRLVLEPARLVSARAAIGAKAAMPDVAARIGAAVSDNLDRSADGQGLFRTYQNGWIMWRADRGALAVYGAIGARWNEHGGTTGFLGWPTTDELATPRGPGRYNHFDHGSIYWSPGTGAHLVYGAIRDKWASLGWEQGALGLPTSDEQDVPGIAGARRNTFEKGEITWTPWAGARVTKLFVPAGTAASGLTIQSVGGGGNPAPAPQVSRHVIITASMDITDDEFWADNEHAHVERRDERWVDSWDPQGVMQLIGKCGGEVRVELAATAAMRPDGSARIQIEVKLYEGTSEETTDLDGTRSTSVVVNADQIVQVPIRINNDDEGGDFADISLVISNTST